MVGDTGGELSGVFDEINPRRTKKRIVAAVQIVPHNARRFDISQGSRRGGVSFGSGVKEVEPEEAAELGEPCSTRTFPPSASSLPDDCELESVVFIRYFSMKGNNFAKPANFRRTHSRQTAPAISFRSKWSPLRTTTMKKTEWIVPLTNWSRKQHFALIGVIGQGSQVASPSRHAKIWHGEPPKKWKQPSRSCRRNSLGKGRL